MAKKKEKIETKETSAGVSRREFLRKSAMGAGMAAAAIGGVTVASAKDDSSIPGSDARPRIPDDLVKSLKTDPVPGSFSDRRGMTGAQVFARACKEEGLAAMFCAPGNYTIINAIANEGIPTYGGRTEGGMCAAADGFIRVSGEIAACSGTEGPGFTNMIMNIGAANAARTPLLVLASNMNISGDDTERGFQQAYQQPTTEGMKKYGKRLITPNRVHEYAGYAFRQLKTGVPKPVHLDFPGEVARARFSDPSELVYFYDKSKYRTESKPCPTAKDIAKAVAMISKSKRPMIVANVGVFYHKAWDALKRLAEKADIAVVESGPSRGHFGDGHRLSASRAPEALMSADLVIMVGQYCMPNVGEFSFNPDVQTIRIDPDPGDIGRNWPIDLGLVSDENTALELLAEAMAPQKREAWVAELASARELFELENDELYQRGLSYSGDGYIHPAVIARGISDVLYKGDIPPDQTTVVGGGYGIARFTRRFVQALRPGQVLNGPYQYGAIGPDVGYTVGAAAAVQHGIGAQAGYQGHPIVTITGDSGFSYTGMEIETLSKYRLPAVIIVYNNNAWGVWQIGQGRAEHMYLYQENVRYDKMGEALGGRGEYITRAEDFAPALKRSYEIAAAERVTTVINCQAKKEYWDRNAYPPGMLGKTEPGCMAYSH